MAEAHHAIKAVVRLTGLSAHVIRIWEKRYSAVKPQRSETNRRLYSEDQIERLKLLRDLVGAGHRIGHVAKLSTAKLQKLAREVKPAEVPSKQAGSAEPDAALLETCFAAVKNLDSRELDGALSRASSLLGSAGLLQRVIAPLAQKIGELWLEGSITAAHEHFASVVIRIFLGHASRPFAGSENSPVIVVATPAGQLHELGALLVAAAATNVGWRVTYLGASLPAAEIAGAARQNRARAVALSLVYPEDDPALGAELVRLRQLLPPDTVILTGGRAAPSYAEAMRQAGARPMRDLDHLYATLEEIRRPARKALS